MSFVQSRNPKGLLRATGKHAKENLPRDKHDFYRTPPEPTRAILKAEYDVLKNTLAYGKPPQVTGLWPTK